MDQLINSTMRDQTPEVYDVLLVKRNANWVETIDELMKGSGKTLIAVGAGHYVGDDSVIAMLRAPRLHNRTGHRIMARIIAISIVAVLAIGFAVVHYYVAPVH